MQDKGSLHHKLSPLPYLHKDTASRQSFTPRNKRSMCITWFDGLPCAVRQILREVK